MRFKLRSSMLIALFALLALVVAACGGDSNDSDSSSGNDDTGEALEAVPTEGGPDAGKVSFAHSAGVTQIVKLPQAMALERLRDGGYEVEETHFQTTTDSIQAVIRGDAVLGNTAPANFFSAVAEGADLVAIVGGGKPDYYQMGKKGLTDFCDAERVGINNPISTTDQLVRMEIEKCGNDPEILSVALTNNRVQALLKNELDAAPAQFSSVPQIEADFTGQIEFLSNTAEDYPEIINTITFVKRSTLTERPRLVFDYITAQLEVVREAYADPTAMNAFAAETITSVQPQYMEAAVAEYLDNDVFPVDGGMSEDEVDATYTSLFDTGIVDIEIDAEDHVDRRPLTLALRELG